MPESPASIHPSHEHGAPEPTAQAEDLARFEAAPVRKKKKLTGEVLLVTAAQVVEQAGIIVLTMMLARILTVAEYGTFRQLWMIHRTLIQVCMLGIPMAVVYYLPKLAAAGHRGLIAKSFWMLMGIGIATAWGVYLGAGAVANAFDNPAIQPLLKVFGLFTMLILPARPLRGILVNYGRANLYAVFTLIDQALLLSVTVGVLLAGGDLAAVVFGLVGLAGLHLLGFLGMMLYVLVLRPLPMPDVDVQADELIDRVSSRAMLIYALPIGISWIVDALNVMFDKLIAATFFSLEDFARYANGAFHVPLVSTIVASTNSVLLPEYVRMHSKGDTAGILRLWHKSVVGTAMLFFPIVAFLIVFATPFVTMMFSATYADSAVIFQVYVLAMLPRMTYFSYVLLGMGLSRDQLLGSVISLVTNVVVSIVLVNLIGVLGPAVGTVIADVALAGYYLTRIRRAAGVGFGQVFPWLKLGKLALAAVAVAFACWPITWVIPGSAVLSLLLGGVCYAALFLAVLSVTGQITKAQRDDLLAKVWRKNSRKSLRRGD